MPNRVMQNRSRHRLLCNNWCRPLYGKWSRIDAGFTIVEGEAECVAVQQCVVPLFSWTRCIFQTRVSSTKVRKYFVLRHKIIGILQTRNRDSRRIHINQRTRCNSFTSLLHDVYVWLNMFRAPPRPLSGAYNCISSLWFAALLVVVWQVTCQTTTNNAPTATLQRQNQKLVVQLYAPDDGRRGARNMLSCT
jgi:hypothetical protein